MNMTAQLAPTAPLPASTIATRAPHNSGSSSFAANSNLTYLSANDQLVVGTGAATPVGLGTTGTVATAVTNFIPQSSSITSLSGVSGEVTVNLASTGQMAYYSGSNAISGTSRFNSGRPVTSRIARCVSAFTC